MTNKRVYEKRIERLKTKYKGERGCKKRIFAASFFYYCFDVDCITTVGFMTYDYIKAPTRQVVKAHGIQL